jgi:hypothetical protein
MVILDLVFKYRRGYIWEIFSLFSSPGGGMSPALMAAIDGVDR